jgi:hypothetical protein
VKQAIDLGAAAQVRRRDYALDPVAQKIVEWVGVQQF